MKKFAFAVAFSLAAASSAQAAFVFSDGFEGDTPGAPAGPLGNWTTIGGVDVVPASNPFGITVGAPASGNVIDLDGTPGPGEITMKNAYAFNAGDLVKLSFVLGGSQRVANASDGFFTRFIFGQNQSVLNASSTGFNLPALSGNFLFAPTFTANNIVGSSAPFSTSTFSFVAGNAGSIRLAFGTNSADNVGPLLDNVSLDIGAAVPEPATWAMMIFGFGLIGTALRSRRSWVRATA